jgi:hypothetical protein
MQNGTLVHTDFCRISGKDYEISVYRRDGRHYVRTIFAPEDVIISDGLTKEEALAKHQHLLPLAINSRQILRDMHR